MRNAVVPALAEDSTRNARTGKARSNQCETEDERWHELQLGTDVFASVAVGASSNDAENAHVDHHACKIEDGDDASAEERRAKQSHGGEHATDGHGTEPLIAVEATNQCTRGEKDEGAEAGGQGVQPDLPPVARPFELVGDALLDFLHALLSALDQRRSRAAVGTDAEAHRRHSLSLCSMYALRTWRKSLLIYTCNYSLSTLRVKSNDGERAVKMLQSSSAITSAMLKSIRKGSTTFFDQPVAQVNQDIIKQLQRVHDEISLVSSTLARFKMYVMRSGISIKTRGGKKTYNFDMKEGEDRVLFEQEIYPAIMQMVHEWLLYGFTCVSVAPSQFVEGALTLVVLPLSMVSVSMVLNECFQREYDVQLSNVIETSEKTRHVIDTAQFLCMTPPDVEGRSMSAVSLCMAELLQYKKLWDDYMLTSHRLGHPVPMFRQSVDPLATLPAGTSGKSVSRMLGGESGGGLGSKATSEIFHDQEERRHAYVKSRMLEAKKMHREGATASPVEDFARFDDPLAHPYVEPPGQTQEPGLRFDSPSDLFIMLTAVEQKFQQAMGLPNDEKVYSTANSVDMYMNLLNTNLIAFRKRASMLISRALAPIFSKRVIQNIVEDIVDEDTQEALDGGSSSSSSAQPSMSETAVEAKARRKRNVSQFDDNQVEEDAAELDNDELKAKLNDVISSTEVVVEFSTNPVTTFEQLTQYYEKDVIPFEQFEEQALDLANIQRWSGKRTMFSETQRKEMAYQEQVKGQVKQQVQKKKARTS